METGTPAATGQRPKPVLFLGSELGNSLASLAVRLGMSPAGVGYRPGEGVSAYLLRGNPVFIN